MVIDDCGDLITGKEYVPMESIFCHEYVLEDRLESFVAYLRTLDPYIIIPSIIVCDETNTIIDGHHRFHALNALDRKTCPITKVDYMDDRIVTHIHSDITKLEIISAALTSDLLAPKSSFHHVIDKRGNCRPILLLSYLSDLAAS